MFSKEFFLFSHHLTRLQNEASVCKKQNGHRRGLTTETRVTWVMMHSRGGTELRCKQPMEAGRNNQFVNYNGRARKQLGSMVSD